MAEKPSNFLRLVSLIWREGTATARLLLVQCREKQNGKNLTEWLTDKRERIQRDVKTKNGKGSQPLYPSQFERLYPNDGDSTTENDLDLTLINYLLNKFCKKVCPKENKDALNQLRELRNDLAHQSDDTVTDDDFEIQWSKAANAIEQINSEAKSKIECLKIEPIDEQAEEYVTGLKLQIDEEKKMGIYQMIVMEQSTRELRGVRKGQQQMRQDLKELSHQIQDLQVKSCSSSGDKQHGTTWNEPDGIGNSEPAYSPMYNFRDGDLRQEDIDDILGDLVPNKSLIVYKNMPKESTLFKDILSLWNTPDRRKGYILIGVRTYSDARKPDVVGMKDDDELIAGFSFFNDKFVQSVPKFRAFKTRYKDKLSKEYCIGVYEIESSEICHESPAFIIKDAKFEDDNVLLKDSLWARIGNSNEIIAKPDATYRRIIEWFDEMETDDITEEEAERFETMYDKSFCESMDYFRNGRNYGHYILISGVLKSTDRRISSCLFKVPWILVLDFDSQEDGLYSMSGKVTKRRIEPYLWKEKIERLDEDYTNWTFLMGPFNDKLEVTSVKQWYENVISSLVKVKDEIDEFARTGSRTIIKILLLWGPQSSELNVYLEKLLNFMEANFVSKKYVKLIACSPCEIPTLQNLSMDNMYFPLDTTQVIANIWKETSNQTDGVTGYLLPMRDKSKGNNPKISFQDSLWIGETLDVLYINDVYESVHNTSEIDAIEMEFLKGAGIGWESWYQLAKGNFSIERTCFQKIRKQLFELLQEEQGSIEIQHNPGGGGTTLAMQLLWSLHNEYPCVQVKSNQFDKSISELSDHISDKVLHIHKLTDFPVLLFIDEPDKGLMEALKKKLNHHSAIILSTKRSIEVLTPNELVFDSRPKKRFNLVGKLDKSESKHMTRCLTKIAPDRKLELEKMSKKKDENLMVYFSLVAFYNEYKGLQSFVRNVFEALPKDQKVLCKYLSFVDYFGSSGCKDMELQKFSKVMGEEEGSMLNDSKIQISLEHLVKPSNYTGDKRIKMMHFLVSRAVLKLELSDHIDHDYDDTSEPKFTDLHNLAMEFIDFVVEDKNVIHPSDHKILSSIYTDRDTGTHYDTVDEQPKFTKLITAIRSDSSKETIKYQQMVLEKLRDTLRLDPHTHAHLARFYYIQCEDYDKAQESFDKAVELVRESILRFNRSRSPSDGSFPVRNKENPHFSKARFVYHMYAMMDISLMTKSTKKLNPKQESKMERFVENMQRGCKHFRKSREEYTSQEFEHFFITYLSEVIHRVKFCKILVDKCSFDLKNMPLPHNENHKYWEKKAVEIVNESFEVIEHLIHKASRCIGEDYREDARIKEANTEYKMLFQDIQVDSFRGESILERRMWNTAVKVKSLNRHADKPSNSDIYGTLTNVFGDHLKTAVRNLEFFLEEVCKDPETAVRDRWIETDLQEWLTAIRLEHFPQDYALNHVLAIVQKCQKVITSPIVIFYTAILHFLVGIGSEKKEGDLLEFSKSISLFDQLKEEKNQRRIRISKYARVREWLGKKGGIKKLITSFKGEPLNLERICKCTGEIKLPNTGRQFGSISLLKTELKECPKLEDGRAVNVHFTFRQKGKKPVLSGRKFAMKKVYFQLCFSMENGL